MKVSGEERRRHLQRDLFARLRTTYSAHAGPSSGGTHNESVLTPGECYPLVLDA
jgi:hypothetical protein